MWCALQCLPASAERRHVNAQLRGNLFIVRRVSAFAHEDFTGGRDFARLAANRARHVILFAQFVENGAANARCRERAERESARSINPSRADIKPMVPALTSSSNRRARPTCVTSDGRRDAQAQMFFQQAIPRGDVSILI